MLHQISSPHAHKVFSTSQVMLEVVVATIPGILVLSYFFGWGTLINILWAGLLALGFEAAIMVLRKRPVGFYLKDFSALVTALLLALAIPPYCPWWVTLIGIFFAIVVAKHAFGGLGYNPFNPAMVGYVVLLISFPVQMTTWTLPSTLLDGQALPSLMESLRVVFIGTPLVDGITSATALDIFKQKDALMVDQLYAQTPMFNQGMLAAVGYEWVNIAFLIGGLFLLVRKTYTWHAPIGMLATLLILPVLFYDGGSSASKGSSFFHLFSGATMLGAFFIVTDPVSGSTSNLGRLIFGVGVGLIVYVIRVWGNYPDALAFGVLLMNFAAPLIDYYTQPRTYGHSKRSHARIKKD